MEPYPGWLNDLRTILVIGWIASAVLAAMLFAEKRPDKPTQQVEQCKLHQRPLHDCPPGSHPTPKDDPPAGS